MPIIHSSKTSPVLLPASLDRFDEINVGDFEYRLDRNGLPFPICMSVIEMRSGRELFLWREELLACRRAPFDTGPRSLFGAFSANAEVLCFLRLGWRLPDNVVDPYVLTAALTNGGRAWPHRNFRPGLLAALQLFQMQGIEAADKDAIRKLILDNETYTGEQRAIVKPYCRSDVVATCALLLAQIDRVDLNLALHWGRFQKAIARQEELGLPTDAAAIDRLMSNWISLQQDAIRRYGVGAFYNGTHFVEERLERLIIDRGWNIDWPRTPTGKFETKLKTIARMADWHPELKPLSQLRSIMTDLRMSSVANSIGADGYSRCSLRPFHTITSRNQPHERDKSFIPALPAWLHGALKPPPGFALIEFDWSAQEVGIMAGLSGDENMIADYRNGDCHSAFALRAALIDDDDDEETRAEVRNKQAKPVVLGSNYGMTPYGIRAKTKRSLDWCRHIHRQHHVIYGTFHAWRDDMVATARFGQQMISAHGWPLQVHSETRDRTLMNYLAQASGVDAMRVAAIAATEAGHAVCCSVHDSFKVLAPLERLDRTIKEMDEIMRMSGATVTGSFEVPAEVKSVVRSPQRLADTWTQKDRGLRTWTEIQARLDSGELPKADNGRDDEDEKTAAAS